MIKSKEVELGIERNWDDDMAEFDKFRQNLSEEKEESEEEQEDQEEIENKRLA